MLKLTVTYDDRGFRAYIPKLAHAAAEGPVEAAEYLAQEWRNRVPVDTGAYKGGIYVITHDSSGYGEAAGTAHGRRPNVTLRPELPRPARKGAAAVGSVVPYDVHNELGTANRPARPAAVPATDLTRRKFPEIMKRRLKP